VLSPPVVSIIAGKTSAYKSLDESVMKPLITIELMDEWVNDFDAGMSAIRSAAICLIKRRLLITRPFSGARRRKSSCDGQAL